MAIVVTLLATSSALLSPSLPLPRCTALRTPTPLLELQEDPPPPTPPPFTTNDAALGGGLYLLLNLLLIETASLVAPSDFGAVALARCAACVIFVALQSTAGLPPAEWLSPQQADADAPSPAIATAAFAAVVLLPPLLLQLSGQSELAAALVPAARPLDAGRAADAILAAPIAEELFFRGWLLAALSRTGLAEGGAAIGASAVAFALWHAGQGDGGLLFYSAFGAFLAALYRRTGTLAAPLGAHAAWNGLILAVRALRQ